MQKNEFFQKYAPKNAIEFLKLTIKFNFRNLLFDPKPRSLVNRCDTISLVNRCDTISIRHDFYAKFSKGWSNNVKIEK